MLCIYLLAISGNYAAHQPINLEGELTETGVRW